MGAAHGRLRGLSRAEHPTGRRVTGCSAHAARASVSPPRTGCFRDAPLCAPWVRSPQNRHVLGDTEGVPVPPLAAATAPCLSRPGGRGNTTLSAPCTVCLSFPKRHSPDRTSAGAENAAWGDPSGSLAEAEPVPTGGDSRCHQCGVSVSSRHMVVPGFASTDGRVPPPLSPPVLPRSPGTHVVPLSWDDPALSHRGCRLGLAPLVTPQVGSAQPPQPPPCDFSGTWRRTGATVTPSQMTTLLFW